ncbi:hypothetical protein Droror1_Dr00010739 [Drosera rotundifolia]
MLLEFQLKISTSLHLINTPSHGDAWDVDSTFNQKLKSKTLSAFATQTPSRTHSFNTPNNPLMYSNQPRLRHLESPTPSSSDFEQQCGAKPKIPSAKLETKLPNSKLETTLDKSPKTPNRDSHPKLRDLDFNSIPELNHTRDLVPLSVCLSVFSEEGRRVSSQRNPLQKSILDELDEPQLPLRRRLGRVREAKAQVLVARKG